MKYKEFKMEDIKNCIESLIKNNNKSFSPNLSKDLMEKVIVYLIDINNNQSKLNIEKTKALTILLTKSRKYTLGCSDMELIKDEVIVLKKLEQIKCAKKIDDLKKIMGEPKITYSGNEIVSANEWVIPEEEIMIWSKTSLTAPLNDIGYRRYMKLFKDLFPNKYEQLF